MDYPPSGHPEEYSFSWQRGRILNEFQLHFIPQGAGTFESDDFLRLVALAFCVAAPLAYLAMERWLEGFAYRIEISWWIFLITGLAALGMALASAIVLGVDSIPAGNEAMQYLMNPKLSWPIALTALGILTGIGLAAGVLPARRAARLDPVESLRYE